jgi:thymidylate synthase (FAD)
MHEGNRINTYPKAKMVAITKPLIAGLETAEDFMAYAARVSNPANQMNTESTPKLLKYLIRNKHWSPFEMVHIVMEINTTRDITHQVIRHRSFAYQEFSQRYSDPTQALGFEVREARLQDNKNRQNSIETNDEELLKSWMAKQEQIIHECGLAYKWAVEQGIAKEQARVILPEGLTRSRLYMAGSLRSWIHYIDVRAPEGTQKEHRIIAQEAQKELLMHFPSLWDYWTKEDEAPTAEEMINKAIVKRWWEIWK